MSEWYYISVPVSPDNFAGTKARQDIETLAERRGMKRIVFLGGNTANRNMAERVRLVRYGLGNWFRLERTVPPNAFVLFQYPHYPMKSAVLARFMTRRIRRRKKVRFVALVHDLNSVRKTFGAAAVYSDSKFLRQFDCVVCHNERMSEYLARQGFDPGRLFSLGVFDYLAEESFAPTGAPDIPSVNIAGNLSREKCGYLYQLLLAEQGYRMYLYGAGLDSAEYGASVQYEGLVPAETLPGLLRGAFGLVWDGNSLDTCAGEYGAYLAINNPHKLSLYLCAGIPVIIWSGAALSVFVRQNHVGFTIDSLRELKHALDAVSENEYSIMQQNAARIGARLRRGAYFNDVMNQLEATCFAD